MNRDLTGYRKSYEKSFLEEKNLPDSPFTLFSDWFTEVEEAGGVEEAKVCLSFFWPNLERQIIIKGLANKVEEEKSIVYFNSRPKGSQLGAWASHQSELITSREVLEQRLASLELEYKDKKIPKPDFWGGYSVSPIEFEFWQGRANRLHDRIRFSKKDEKWIIDRLSP